MRLAVALMQHIVAADGKLARTGEDLVLRGHACGQRRIRDERLKGRAGRIQPLCHAVQQRAVRACGERIPVPFNGTGIDGRCAHHREQRPARGIHHDDRAAMRAERAPCRLRERGVHRQAHIIACIRTQERTQRSHAIHIGGHARKRPGLDALHPRRAVPLRTVARHGSECRTVGIGSESRGIALG